jgi:hypothetical protein
MFRGRTHGPVGIIAALGVALGVSSGAIAADIPMPTKAVAAPIRPIDAWTFSATPYGWVPLLNGSTTARPMSM